MKTEISFSRFGRLVVFGLMGSGLLGKVPEAWAQNNAYYDAKALHFGFHVGINRSSHHMLLKDSLTLPGLTNLNYVSPVFGPGFQLGIVSDARLHEYLALRFTPTLMFSQRNFQFDFANQSIPVKKSIQMANVDLPLTLKFRSKRMKDYRVYVLGGAQSKYRYGFPGKSRGRCGPRQIAPYGLLGRNGSRAGPVFAVFQTFP